MHGIHDLIGCETDKLIGERHACTTYSRRVIGRSNTDNARRAAVASTLNGATLSVTALARGMRGSAYEKHRIKRADRLLSNAHLHNERVEIYTTLARRVLTGTHRPIISVDWSNLNEGKRRFLLRASVAVEGRSFTLYEQVHPREQFMKAAVERRYLGVLKEILGSERQPIVVTDAGFHNPWMRAVRALGWDGTLSAVSAGE